MRKFAISVLLLLIIPLSLVLVASIPGATQHLIKVYNDSRSLHADPTAETLVIGASVTYRWPERAPDSWRAVFGPHAAHMGRPGLRTADVMRALPIHTNARWVVVDLGGPDVRHGVPPYVAAVRVAHIVESLLASTDARIEVLEQMAPDVSELNPWIIAALPENPRLRFVSIGLVDMLPDGKHPTRVGYAQIAANL